MSIVRQSICNLLMLVLTHRTNQYILSTLRRTPFLIYYDRACLILHFIFIYFRSDRSRFVPNNLIYNRGSSQSQNEVNHGCISRGLRQPTHMCVSYHTLLSKRKNCFTLNFGMAVVPRLNHIVLPSFVLLTDNLVHHLSDDKCTIGDSYNRLRGSWCGWTSHIIDIHWRDKP